jgi:hypothetical protein
VKDIGVSAEELAALLDGRPDQSRRPNCWPAWVPSEEAL